jgi:ATP-dependent phosphofructokinase / diphosphate-dependent phosphofructokinase
VPARGALVVGQSGGPTAVINRSLAGVVESAIAAGDAVGEIVGMRHGVEGLLAEDLVDLRRQAPTLLADLKETPSSALGACRYRLRDDDLDRALAVLRRVGARYFVYIGGNDSADTTHRLAGAARAGGYDLTCVGVPKTVDNDLVATDHCPGYGSAARFLAIALMEASRDTEAMRRSDPVKIVEVAGRHAGWLPAAAALGRRSAAEGPHLVYVPERPLSQERILEDIEAAYRAYAHVVVVLSENQPDPSGTVLGSGGAAHYVDPFGHAYYDSPGESLARSVRAALGLRARFERPGALQRMSIAYRSETDAAEALAVGSEAVRLALGGVSDVMVILERESNEPYRCGLGTAPLEAIANRQRLLPPEYVNEAGNGPSDAFRRYALPLLGAPLPRHARLL